MLNDVEVRQLRALHAVAVEGSFARAADRLGFTQSAISQQIAALERAVGDRVFDRPGGPKRVELTPVGEVVLAHAEAVLALYRETDDHLKSLRAGEVGRLVVGSFQSVSVNILPKIIGRLRVDRPGLSVRCIENDENDELIERLLSDDIDLSFLVGLPDNDAIDGTALLVDPFVLLSAGALGPASVDTFSLALGSMIGQQECACQLSVDRSLLDYGVVPDYVFRSNDNAAVQAMVRTGMGRAILPFLAVDANDPEVTVSLLDPPLPPRVLVLARKRGRTLPPAADRFFELAVEVCRQLQQQQRQACEGVAA